MTQQYNNNYDRELGWDDPIQADATEYILLPDGDYIFTVEKFERERHTPNPQNPGKLPACNKAVIHLIIESSEGVAKLRHNLFLHSSVEGMLSAFFASIGQKKRGEQLKMDWTKVTGAKGVCRVGTKVYNNNKYNEVKSMIYAEDVEQEKIKNANINVVPTPQPQNQMPFQTNYTQPTVPQGF